MNARTQINEISNAVKLCVKALDPRDNIMSNIMFEAEDNEMKMMAMNNSYSIIVSFPCDVQEYGCATVDGKMAYSVITKGVSTCTLTADERNMTIKTIGRTRLPNIDRELPLHKDVEGDIVKFDAVSFKNAISRIDYAISEDQSRIVLTGAHVVTDGISCTITSIDGFRLAQTTIPCNGDAIDIIIPSRILSAVCDAITDGEITLTTNGNGVSIVGNNFKINALLITGAYIDTKKIIPNTFTTNVLAKTIDIKRLVDLATVASGVSNLVKLVISSDKISIMANSNSADNSNGADFYGDVDALVEGPELAISFNLKYLISLLNHINTEQCEVKFNSSVSPCVIVPHENMSNDINLVLPVRTFS